MKQKADIIAYIKGSLRITAGGIKKKINVSVFWIDSKSMTDEQRACQGTNNSPGEDELKHNAVSVADGDLGSSKFVVLWCYGEGFLHEVCSPPPMEGVL